MTRKTKAILTSFLAAGLAFGTAAGARSFSSQDPQTQPDNTRMNKQDDSKSATTADQQKETPADRDMAKKIRRAITSDSSLSTYAHNVKVIVRNGTVTLKGPVKSDEEKNAVAAKATEIAGADKVQNQLTVKS